MDDMRAAIELALTKVKERRPAPGKYRGTVTATLAIDLRVGEDFEQRVSTSAPWRSLFALAASKLNQATIDLIVKQALNLPRDEDGKVVLEGDLAHCAERAQDAVDAIMGTTLRPCKGQVRGSAIVVDVLSQDIERESL